MLLKIYHLLVKRIPFKLAFLKIAAILPPLLKKSAFFRFISNAACYVDPSTIVISNFGINHKLRIQTSIAHPIAAFGTPRLYKQEEATLFLSKEVLKHTDAFVDVGANIGYFCFYVDAFNPDQKPIYFFEPDDVLYRSLIANQQKNNKKFIGNKQAISNKNGSITFYRNLTDDSSGSIKNTFKDKHQLEAVTIDAITFDTFAESVPEKRFSVKVDVEGAEFEFMEGARKSISNMDFLIIELLQDAIDQKFPEMMIKDYQYHAYYINNYQLEYSKNGEYRYVAPYFNWMFSSYDPEKLRKILRNTPFTVIH